MSAAFDALSEEFVAAYARDLYHCSSCNYCVDAVWPERGMTAVCATMESHGRGPGYSGRGFIEAARAVFEGLAVDADALATRVFTCTTCGNCERACPIGLRPASVGRALRAELVARDALPPPLHALRAAMEREGNPQGAPRAARHAWRERLVDDADAQAPVFFAGCAAALGDPDEARAALALLRAAGLHAGLTESGCCGAPLTEIGCVREGEALLRAARGALGEREAVIAGSECRRQFGAARTHSVAGWLCAAWRAGRVHIGWRPEVTPPAQVTLVESCQLQAANRGEQGDEHAVAALFAALGVELTRDDFPNRHATCCGAAGGMPRMAPDSAAAMARARLPPSGVALSLDTRCANHLRDAAAAGVTVLGFARFVQRYFTVSVEDAR